MRRLLRLDAIACQEGPFFGAVVAQAELMGGAGEAGLGFSAQIVGALAVELLAVDGSLPHQPNPERAMAWHTSVPAGDTSHWAAVVPAARVVPPQLRGFWRGSKLRLVITTVVG